MDILTLARYVIYRSHRVGNTVHPLRLQMILYFLYLWYCSKYGEKSGLTRVEWAVTDYVPRNKLIEHNFMWYTEVPLRESADVEVYENEEATFFIDHLLLIGSSELCELLKKGNHPVATIIKKKEAGLLKRKRVNWFSSDRLFTEEIELPERLKKYA